MKPYPVLRLAGIGAFLAVFGLACAGRQAPTTAEAGPPVEAGTEVASVATAEPADTPAPAVAPSEPALEPAPAPTDVPPNPELPESTAEESTAAERAAPGTELAPDDPAAIVAAPKEEDFLDVEEIPQVPKRSLRELCRAPTGPPQSGILPTSRRILEETFCGATLWFDGLFGGNPDVDNARAVNGRIEIGTLYTRAEGFSVKPRLHLDYDLPTLERKLKLFLGRDDRDEFVQDRREGAAIRSSIYDLENEDGWLAGLGYSMPGRWADKVDFRVGVRAKTAPEIFGQVRFRKNWFVGEAVVVRFRETAFWENREDGFGSTTTVDVDRVLTPRVLLRGNAATTISESTDGAYYRTAGLLYHNIPRIGAVAYEIFAEGETKDEVPLREFGGRVIYRRPIGYEWMYGEFILGYTFPREYVEEPREGSAMIGFGIELFFGRRQR